MEYARLTRYGLLHVTGEQAREFLHAQLTNDIASLPANRAALAGWCSAKGRLLASFLVIPVEDGFLLQVSRDLAAAVAKRLSMFILRAKVRIADQSDAWTQLGAWGAAGRSPKELFVVGKDGAALVLRVGEDRVLLLSREPSLPAGAAEVAEARWTLDEIRAGRPLITAATQDLFVPQMVNLELLGGVNFQKGCYPGQEIVARAQYRGQVKRRMKRLLAPHGTELHPGQEFEGGTVVDAAPAGQAVEVLAVMPVEGA